MEIDAALIMYLSDSVEAQDVKYNFKEGTDFYPTESDNFFVGNSFPTCNINFSAQEIMGQTKENQ